MQIHRHIFTILVLLAIALTLALGLAIYNDVVARRQVNVPVDQPATGEVAPEPDLSGTIIPPTKTDCTDELDTACWNTYRNEEYGFEFKYPSPWFLGECRTSYYEKNVPPFSILLSDVNDVDCTISMGGRINLRLTKQYRQNKEWSLIGQDEMTVNGMGIEQFYYQHEIRGGEGEKLAAEPKLRIINSVIPSKNGYIIVDYYQIFSVNTQTLQGFKVQQDFSDIYSGILRSFRSY